MTTPARMLPARLYGRESIELRTLDGKLEEQITYTQTVYLASRGEIEGVGPKSGAIRFVRRLRAAAIEQPAAAPAPAPACEPVFSSAASAIARTRLGVRRQALREVVVEEILGHRFVVAEGELRGYCYTFCGVSL